MRVCGLSHRGRGAFRSESADRPCHWQADCCCSVCSVRSPGGPGCRTYRQLTALADRLADISAQIRIRLTVLLAAGIALGAAGLGFEAILGAFTAGVLVRMLDRARTGRPPLLIKLETISFGLLIPVFPGGAERSPTFRMPVSVRPPR